MNRISSFSRARPVSLYCAVVVFAAACTSTPEKKSGEAADTDPKPIQQIVEATNKPESIGKFLADTDLQIRAWTTLRMTAQSEEDRRKARDLQLNLKGQTHKRLGELIEQLETGPLNNRVVAASALGFSNDPEAQSPLIAALEDPHAAVVSNALLGLSLLGRADTPLERICEHLQSHTDGWVRCNAALCAADLVTAGARSECILTASRLGLLDKEPAVRSQCALILATLIDSPSLSLLIDKLYDPVPLVSAAAARAVSYIGAQNLPDRGPAARGLIKAYETARGAPRNHVLLALIQLSGTNYGTDAKDWEEWARRLP